MIRLPKAMIILTLTAFIITRQCLAESREYGYTEPVKEKVSYAAENLRDPFKSYLPVEEEVPSVLPGEEEVQPEEEIILPTFTVQGVIWGSSLPQAIIDDTVVKIGDVIEGARITNITRDNIELNYQGKDFVVKTTYTK